MNLLLSRTQETSESWPNFFQIDTFIPYKLVFQNNPKLATATKSISNKTWIIFSSSFAITCFFANYSLPITPNYGVVGKKTKKNLASLLELTNILEAPNLQNLIQQITKNNPTAKIIHPTSYDSLRFVSPVYPKSISLARYPFYQRENLTYSPTQISRWQKKYDCIFFASPSCFESTCEILGKKFIQEALSFAALGETTADHIRCCYPNHKIWIPSSPSLVELIRTLENVFPVDT